MHLAWHIAKLHRAKKIPGLKALLAKVSENKTQTWQEQQAVMDMWVAHTHRIARNREQMTKPKKLKTRKHGRK